MGVDLTLLPVEGDGRTLRFCHSILQCERRNDLWSVIDALNAKPCSEVSCYLATGVDGDSTYGTVSEDPYGTPITSLTAGELITVSDHEAVMDNSKNRAVWAYLREINPATEIVLWWH